MNKQVRKYVLNISVLLLVTALALFFVLKDDAKGIFNTLKSADLKYVGICLVASFTSYILDTLILVLLARIYKPDYKFKKGFFNDMIGRFFSGITPSSTGGQISQAYTFNKQGVSLTNSASILVMSFIIYEFSLVCFSAVTLIYSACTHSLPAGYIPIFGLRLNVISLSIIGFGISFTIIAFLLIFSLSRRIHRFFVNIVCGLGKFFHIIKKDKVEDTRIHMNASVETFRIETKRLLSNLGVLVSCVILYTLEFAVANIVPFFAANACGANIPMSQFFNAISYSNFTYLITQMIPIPGASGGAEYVFALMYGDLIADTSILKASILVWRFSGFYFGLFFGAIIFLVYHESPKMETLHYSSKTLLEIEVIHLNNEINEREVKEVESVDTIEIGDVEELFNKIKHDLDETLKANNAVWEKEQRVRRRKKKND